MGLPWRSFLTEKMVSVQVWAYLPLRSPRASALAPSSHHVSVPCTLCTLVQLFLCLQCPSHCSAHSRSQLRAELGDQRNPRQVGTGRPCSGEPGEGSRAGASARCLRHIQTRVTLVPEAPRDVGHTQGRLFSSAAHRTMGVHMGEMLLRRESG